MKPAQSYIARNAGLLAALFLSLIVIFGTLFFQLDLFDQVAIFLLQHEGWELDEIILVLLLLAVGTTLDVLRYRRQTIQKQEMERQRNWPNWRR